MAYKDELIIVGVGRRSIIKVDHILGVGHIRGRL